MAARAQATRQDILPQVDRLANGALVAARRVSRRRGMSLLALAREVLYLSRRGWRLRFGLRLTPRPRGGVGFWIIRAFLVGIWLKPAIPTLWRPCGITRGVTSLLRLRC